MLSLPPLGLYVHLPWCVRKCPYCDFNSHELRGELPAAGYVDQLLLDLDQDLPLVWGRPVVSIFIGGGTPSLFPPEEIDRLLSGIRARCQLHPGAEVTMEANPGAAEYANFAAYADAGVTRFSLGVQSFDDAALQRIGRIHSAGEARQAIAALRKAGLDNFNIDLMFALPGQNVEAAIRDVEWAIAAEPAHISHYQLTIEPNTAFAANPPGLPDADVAWSMQEESAQRLRDAGFGQYEVSAWARPGAACEHNLNYWRFGDYLGIGAGAHGKITLPQDETIRRIAKQRSPARWLAARPDDTGKGRGLVAADHPVEPASRVFEFFLNGLRLREGIRPSRFEARTGLDFSAARQGVSRALELGLLAWQDSPSGRELQSTELGWRFVNDIQALFLHDEAG